MTANASHLRRVLRSIGSSIHPTTGPGVSSLVTRLSRLTDRAALVGYERVATRRCAQRGGLLQQRQRRWQSASAVARTGTSDDSTVNGGQQARDGSLGLQGGGWDACQSSERRSDSLSDHPARDSTGEQAEVETGYEGYEQQRALVEDAATAPDPAPPVASKRERDGPRVKRPGELNVRYARDYGRDARNRLHKQLTRWQRQSKKPSSTALQFILCLLEGHTEKGGDKHAKRREILRLPRGLRAVWTRNPGEAILEVMLRTGTHVQTLPGDPRAPEKADKTLDESGFDALVLYGTPAQNSAAVNFLQDSDIVEAVDAKNSHASKRLKDYSLRSEVARPSKAAPDPLEEQADTGALHRLWETEAEEEQSHEQLQGALNTLTETKEPRPVPLRAVWSRHPHGMAVCAPSRVPRRWNALTLTLRVGDLVQPLPRQKRRKLLGSHAYNEASDSRRSEIVALLTDPECAAHLTSEALEIGLSWLARHRFLPDLRFVLSRLDNIGVQPTANCWNNLLAHAAKEEDVANFASILKSMTRSSTRPNLRTWMLFYALVSRRFPAEAPHVKESMRKFDVLDNREAMLEYVGLTATRGLDLHLNAGGNLESYLNVQNESMRARDLQRVWLTTSVCNGMMYLLLSRARTTDAMQLLSDLEKRGRKPNAITLNTLLTAALREEDVSGAVAYLRRLPEVRPDEGTYHILFRLAWVRRYFNCLRVIWRYACCAGHITWRMQARVTQSLVSQISILTVASDGKLEHNTGGNKKVVSRQDVWHVWAGRFAIGVAEGLSSRSGLRALHEASTVDISVADVPVADVPFDPEHRKHPLASLQQHLDALLQHHLYGADKEYHIYTVDSPDREPTKRPLATFQKDHRDQQLQTCPFGNERAAKHRGEDLPAIEEGQRFQAPALSPEVKRRREALLNLVLKDINEVTSLAPILSLVDKLEEAWRIDLEWKAIGLASTKVGGEKTFRRMLESGVKVPVKEPVKVPVKV